MSHIADLGTVCVLNADSLVEGSYLNIDGRICCVDRIVNEQVFLRAVVGKELWKYRFSHIRKWAFNSSMVIPVLLALAYGGCLLIFQFCIRPLF